MRPALPLVAAPPLGVEVLARVGECPPVSPALVLLPVSQAALLVVYRAPRPVRPALVVPVWPACKDSPPERRALAAWGDSLRVLWALTAWQVWAGDLVAAPSHLVGRALAVEPGLPGLPGLRAAWVWAAAA